MKKTDWTGYRPETIALYERLEAERYPGFNPKNPAHWLLGVAVWPAVLMRSPKATLVILFAGLLMGAANAWKSPAVVSGLLLGGAVVVMTSKAHA